MSNDQGVHEWDMTPSSGPRCAWYNGCANIASIEGLCLPHFDATERPQHAAAQREHEARINGVELLERMYGDATGTR